jgi:hypothetical protein
MKRGDLVVREGKRGTVTHCSELGWVVVFDIPEPAGGPQAVSMGGGTPADAGWALDSAVTVVYTYDADRPTLADSFILTGAWGDGTLRGVEHRGPEIGAEGRVAVEAFALADGFAVIVDGVMRVSVPG